MLLAYVLNLERRPDRRATFEQLNQRDGISFEFLAAVDGQHLSRAQLIQAGLLHERADHFSAGDLGCALSHRLAWQRCLETDAPSLVFEDDAILRGDFVEGVTDVLDRLPAGWDIVLLGYNFDSVVDVEIVPGIDLQSRFSLHFPSEEHLQRFREERQEPVVLPLNNGFGACGYALAPSGAKQLLNLCFPLAGLSIGVPALNRILAPTGTIDAIMNAHYRRMTAFCVIPPLVLSPNNQHDSDARKPEKPLP